MVQQQESDEATAKRAMREVHPHTAGIDVGSRSHWVAVGAERDAQPVREFGSFTGDVVKMADWLASCGVTTVAMESTGVYWIPVYDVLEARGFEVLLVNAKHVRNVPGRKSDVKDCQWLQQLHGFGLLRGSFRPTQEILELRTYTRQRSRIVRDAARCVQHMEKAMLEMNLQLHHVISELTGVTGMAIVRAIVSGERDGRKLAELRDRRCREPKEKLAAALQGTFKNELVFVLEQSLSAYDHQIQMLAKCDERIEQTLAALEKAALEKLASEGKEPQPCPPPKPRQVKGNQPKFEIQSPLHRICGDIDITQIIPLATALNFVAEVGTDMSRWPTEKHFAAWLTLAPGTHITGGQSLSGRRGPAKNRAGLILRQAAVAIGKTQTALGGFYRRLSARGLGSTAAIATARKIAVFIYRALKYGRPLRDVGLAAYEQQFQDRQVRHLGKRAAALGYQIVPIPTQAAAGPN